MRDVPIRARPFEDGLRMRRAERTVLPASSEGGGSAPVASAARKAGRKQSRPGVGSRDKQNPKEQRARKIEAWCQGKMEKYT